jgi:hypothetical protein
VVSDQLRNKLFLAGPANLSAVRARMHCKHTATGTYTMTEEFRFDLYATACKARAKP